MDYPKNTPNVGLIGGKFADENAATGQPGSLIPAAWGNALTDEVLNVIKAAGIAPSEADQAQLLQAIQAIAASDVKRSVLCATTGPIPLSGLQTIDGVALTTGDRVLVKDQANAAQNWIYTAAPGAWNRALDASVSEQCTPGHLIIVQAGSAHAGAVWQFTGTALPVLGTSALIFAVVYGRSGVAAGTYRSVTVDQRGRVVQGSNPTSLDGYGITDALRVALGHTSVQRPSLAAPEPGSGNTPGGGGAIELREAVKVEGTRTETEYGPGIMFHWGGVIARLLQMDAAGELRMGGRKLLHEGNLDLSTKADKATTLGGYGITDAYRKVDTDYLIGQAVAPLAIKATTLGGYGISDAYTRTQADAAIANAINALVNGAGASLDTLSELAAALNNDPNFAANIVNSLAAKFDKSGGAIKGRTSIETTDQSLDGAGLVIGNAGQSSSTQSVLALACGSTLVNLVHQNLDPTLKLRDRHGNAMGLDAGTVYSFGYPVHSTTTFFKPDAGLWVVLSGSGVLPAGGTWAYFTIGFTSGGNALGASAGVAAGGTAVGQNTNSHGFAWRIQ